MAEKRVKRVLENLRLVGNLANRNNYDYTEADFDKILIAVEAEIKRLKAKVKAQGASSEASFTLQR